MSLGVGAVRWSLPAAWSFGGGPPRVCMNTRPETPATAVTPTIPMTRLLRIRRLQLVQSIGRRARRNALANTAERGCLSTVQEPGGLAPMPMVGVAVFDRVDDSAVPRAPSLPGEPRRVCLNCRRPNLPATASTCAASERSLASSCSSTRANATCRSERHAWQACVCRIPNSTSAMSGTARPHCCAPCRIPSGHPCCSFPLPAPVTWSVIRPSDRLRSSWSTARGPTPARWSTATLSCPPSRSSASSLLVRANTGSERSLTGFRLDDRGARARAGRARRGQSTLHAHARSLSLHGGRPAGPHRGES